MSLKLVWTDDATTYPDLYLNEVVTNVIEAKVDTFHIAQCDLLNAFRLAIVRNQIEHTAITLDVQETIHHFNQYGNFVDAGPWPVPSAGDQIVEDLLRAQVAKKRALSAGRSVD